MTENDAQLGIENKEQLPIPNSQSPQISYSSFGTSQSLALLIKGMNFASRKDICCRFCGTAGDGRLITTLQGLQGHSDRVLSVSFSPDNQTIASASSNGTIKLWSIEGEELNTLTGHHNQVWDVSFSSDGKTLASASWDDTVILWNLDLDNLLARGCDSVRDHLKTNENVEKRDRRLCS